MPVAPLLHNFIFISWCENNSLAKNILDAIFLNNFLHWAEDRLQVNINSFVFLLVMRET